MHVALLIARLGLAGVFLAAGLGKLADLEGSRKAMRGFGLPEPLAPAAGLVLPLVELAVAVTLLPRTTALWGTVVALALLAVFVGAIVVSLARGEAPDCHCFGALHSEPIGPKTLVRNGVLAAVAVFVVVAGWSGPGPSALAWLGRLDTTGLALLVVSLGLVLVLGLGTLAFVHLLRQNGRLLLRLDRVEEALAEAGLLDGEVRPTPEIGNPPGSAAPAFSLVDFGGGTTSLADLLAPGLPAMLVFTSPTCGPCRTLLPRIAEWQGQHADVLTIAVVSGGEEEAAREHAAEHRLHRVLHDPEHTLYDAYKASGTPSAVIVEPDGTIGSWTAPGADWIERLLEDSVPPPPEPAAGLPVGEQVPEVIVADLDGRPTRLTEVATGEIVLVFWNPACGFCRELHPDLLRWEQSALPDLPGLVVVSMGDAESSRAEGFRSPVVLDPDWKTSTAFHAGGTPMAVRLDAEGRVQSALVSGATAVIQLLRTPVATAG